MTNKEFLQQAYRIDGRIQSKYEQIQNMRDLSIRATSSTTAERVSGTPSHSKVETCVCAIIDLEADIKTAIIELANKRTQIQQEINAVEDQNYKMLLELRYLNFKTWGEIAQTMGYSTRWTIELHGRALAEFKTHHCSS